MSSTSQQHGYLLIANYPNLKLKLGAFGHLRSHIQPLQASSGENVRLTVHAWKGYWSCSPLTYLTPTLFVNLLSGDFRPEVHTHTHAAQARVYPELNINTDQVVLLIVNSFISSCPLIERFNIDVVPLLSSEVKAQTHGLLCPTTSGSETDI